MDQQDLPGRQDEQHDGDGAAPPGAGPERTLSDEIVSLIEDGQNYFEAEIQFQKTRVSFAADRGKKGLVFVFGALAFLHLALIALVVGLVIALAPLAGVWGALGIVVGLLFFGVALMGWLAKRHFTAIAGAFKQDGEP